MVNSVKIKNNNRLLIFILFLGLILRLLYSFWLSKYLLGSVTFKIGDSFSYTNSFLNLLNYGIYSFDLDEPDAYFSRGPIYPLFWGIHYLVFGKYFVYESIAISQSVLDVFSGYLIYKIILSLKLSHVYGLIGLIIYLINPILIVHVPNTGTETFSIFLTLLYFYSLIKLNARSNIYFSGLICGICCLTRQYLGILLPIGFIFLLLNHNNKFITKNILLLSFGFCLIVSPWVFRNLYYYKKPILLMGRTSGYQVYQEDFIAFNDFYSLFYVDVTPLFNSIATTGKDTISNPKLFYPFYNDLIKINEMSFSCGPSFYAWRNGILFKKDNNIANECKYKLVNDYKTLKNKIINNRNVFFRYKISLLNLKKSIFKFELVKKEYGFKQLFINFCFLFRTSYILLGLIALFFIRDNYKLVIFAFPLFMFIFISFYIQHVEIRFYAQAEAILIILSAYSIFKLKSYLFS